MYTRGVPTICTIAGGVLKCTNSGEGSNILQLCPGVAVTDDLFLGNVVESGCVVPTLEVVPVCMVPWLLGWQKVDLYTMPELDCR